MAESLETIIGTGMILTAGALTYSAGYTLEKFSENGYKLGIALSAIGFLLAAPLMFIGPYLVNQGIPEEK
ncbi:MAG: hypothetical protein PHC66_02970 [Candidatus Nanoarchaeia archaeon]|nr:hypothetical protein [Candidatus Nanoarchaeia archaeon]MDD5239022.1 hypothetical protein [Candidatus Nanoarchaeia archaeon]